MENLEKMVIKVEKGLHEGISDDLPALTNVLEQVCLFVVPHKEGW